MVISCNIFLCMLVIIAAIQIPYLFIVILLKRIFSEMLFNNDN
jgi:hypothetical protein